LKRSLYLLVSFLWLSSLICWSCSIRPTLTPSEPSGFNEAEVKELIEKFGPVLYMHPAEKYKLDNPEDILNRSSLHIAIVNESEWNTDWDSENAFRKFSIRYGYHFPNITAETLVNQVNGVLNDVKPRPPYNNNQDFRYWIEYPDSLESGDSTRAKALIRVLPVNAVNQEFTEIQFWFYYPFNGPGRLWFRIASGLGACSFNSAVFKLNCEENLDRYGRHYGDWEYVSLLIRNTSKNLVMVAMSRHGDMHYFQCKKGGVCKNTVNPNEQLEFERYGHPRVYSAINTHAIYNRENHRWVSKRAFAFNYKIGTVSADIIDRTKTGEAFEAWKPGKYRIIKSTLPNYKVTPPDWLGFGGRWGKHENLKENIFRIRAWAVYVWKETWGYTQHGVCVGPRSPNMNQESVFKGLIIGN